MPRVDSSYSTAERGGGAPVELYTFQRGANVWRYVSGPIAQVFGGLTYLPSGIKRGNFQQKQDAGGMQVTVACPIDLAVSQALTVETSEPCFCTIQRVQTPSGTAISAAFLAQTIAVKFSAGSCEFTLATVEYFFKTQIPKVRLARTCQWALYSPSCGVDPATFAESRTVSTISGQDITVNALTSATPGAYNNGIIRLASGRVLFIAKQVGTVLSVWAKIPPELAVSDAVTVYRGCDKQFATCETAFNNAKNFMGYPNLPERNVALAPLR
jgi:uncharacterized phage protein (TIGR02218 family)